MADHRRGAAPRIAMGGDQDSRVDLEMAGRIGRDIGGRADGLDMVRRPQQQAANLVGRFPRQGGYPVDQRS